MANAAKKISKLDQQLGKFLVRWSELAQQLEDIEQQLQQAEDRRAETVRLAASGDQDQAEITRLDQETEGLKEQHQVQRELVESLDRDIHTKKLEIFRLEQEARQQDREKWKGQEDRAWEDLFRAISKLKLCRRKRGLDPNLAFGAGFAHMVWRKAASLKPEESQEQEPQSQYLSRVDREALEKEVNGERAGEKSAPVWELQA